MITTPVTIGTDFSGLGSPEEALKRHGVEHRVVFACEKDVHARKSYLANHNPGIFYDDITTRDNSETPYCDIYFSGFPCQAFSLAGKRLGFEDTRGTLFFNSLDYIAKKRPRVFVMENVKGLLSHDKKKGTKGKYGNTFNTILDCLGLTVNGQFNLHRYNDCVGYHVYFQVLNAKDYGIPQNRERVFIVGFRDEIDAVQFRYPKPFKLELRLKDMLQDNPDGAICVAMRGRNIVDGKRVDYLGAPTEQRLEYNMNGTTNCLTCVQKDNLLVVDYNSNNIIPVPEKYYLSEKMVAGLIEKTSGNQVGYINQDTQASKVFNDELPIDTICSGTHGYAIGYIQVTEATKQGYAIAEVGDTINLSNPSKTRRGRVGKQIANTFYTACNQAVVVGNIPGLFESRTRIYDENGLSPTCTAKTGGGHEPIVKTGTRIRRLTPREVFRLMGYTDDFFERCEAVNSDTQLYRQGGNSIVVDVLYHLLTPILTIK